MSSSVGLVELLLSLTGTGVGGAKSVAVQAALQHPLSMGRITLGSSDAFDQPVIDPGYLSVEGGKWAFLKKSSLVSFLLITTC